jgi:hypothetical protein
MLHKKKKSHTAEYSTDHMHTACILTGHHWSTLNSTQIILGTTACGKRASTRLHSLWVLSRGRRDGVQARLQLAHAAQHLRWPSHSMNCTETLKDRRVGAHIL